MHACDGDFFSFLLGFWLVADAVLIIVSSGFLAAWQMVKEAIGTLKERTGSSQYAIAKYLEDMYKTGLPPNFKKILSIQLRNMTKQGKVYKVKNSFKLSDELKKPVKAPKAAMAIKDSSKEIKAYKPTKVAKKDSSRVKSKTANGALSKAVKLGGVAVVAKPTKVPKSPKAPKSVKHVAVKPPRKAPVAASKSKDEEKVTAPSAARKPAASLTNKPTAVKKTASKKKVGTPRKAPKSVKSAKSKSSKSAVIPGKISKTVASPAKRAKK
jgi:histone H1/5